jgi:hypothetical protein
MNTAKRKRGLNGCSRDILHRPRVSPCLSPLRLEGFQDDQAGEASPCYGRPRVSKLLKEGHQARVHSDQMVEA